MDVRENVARIKSNWIGGAAGAIGGFLVAKKVAKTQKTWILIGSAVVGAVAGAVIQAKIAAKKGAPTKKTVEG